LLQNIPLGGFRQTRRGLKLNGTHHLLIYAEDVNILGGSIYTIRKNRQALVIISKEIGLEMLRKLNRYVSRSECRTKQKLKRLLSFVFQSTAQKCKD
jgi:hypothetical protein